MTGYGRLLLLFRLFLLFLFLVTETATAVKQQDVRFSGVPCRVRLWERDTHARKELEWESVGKKTDLSQFPLDTTRRRGEEGIKGDEDLEASSTGYIVLLISVVPCLPKRPSSSLVVVVCKVASTIPKVGMLLLLLLLLPR